MLHGSPDRPSNNPNPSRELTVFISSRTEELWQERSAAYDALGAIGHIPIIFEASLNHLTDDAIPNWPETKDERRFSNRRILRDQLDSMVDISDFFVGIYFMTAGPHDEIIDWMTWIEYELLRFLTRYIYSDYGFDEFEGYGVKPKLRLLSPPDPKERNEINDMMRSQKWRTTLYDMLNTPPKHKGKRYSDKLHELLRQRVRLYTKQSAEGLFEGSRRLGIFLETLQRHVIPFSSLTKRSGNQREDYHHLPSHADLFNKIYEPGWHLANRAGDRIQYDALQDDKIKVSIDSNEANEEGSLYKILRLIFQNGMDINKLFIGCRGLNPEEKSTHIVQCVLTPFRNTQPVEQLSKKLENMIRNDLPDKFEVRVSPDRTPSRNGSPPCGNPAKCQLRSCHRKYRLRVINLPGILWSVTSLITAFGGNIKLFLFDESHTKKRRPFVISKTSNRQVVEFIVGINHTNEKQSCLLKENHVTFEHQLKNMRGYVGAEALELDTLDEKKTVDCFREKLQLSSS